MKDKRVLSFSDYTVPEADAAQKQRHMRAILAARRQVRERSLRGQLRTQIAYMSKGYWAACLLLALALTGALLLAQHVAAPEELQALLLSILGAAGPLFCALSAPVLCRSHMQGMWELEESSFHNLARLTTLRLGITTAAFLPAMLLLLFGAGSQSLFNLCALVTPFLLACSANYAIMGRWRGLGGCLACIGADLLIAGGMTLPVLIAPMLAALPTGLPIALAILSAGLYGWSLRSLTFQYAKG